VVFGIKLVKVVLALLLCQHVLPEIANEMLFYLTKLLAYTLRGVPSESIWCRNQGSRGALGQQKASTEGNRA
jgi:hypothetical protein